MATWANANNLQLNPNKSIEMIVKRSRCSVPLPPTLPGITMVKEMNILGGQNPRQSINGEAH